MFRFLRRSVKSAGKAARTVKPRCRPLLEALEDRTLPSTITVVTSDDTGPGSLRDAINQVNGDVNPAIDTINFAFSGFLDIESALPTITHSVIIQGPDLGFIFVDGSAAGPDANGFVIAADNCIIENLYIMDWAQNGIVIQGTGNQVINNQIQFNQGNGVFIDGASGNTIGGSDMGQANTISGNLLDGILIQGSATSVAQNNIVAGNFIGTDSGGFFSYGSQVNGVELIDSANNTIGGSSVFDRNLISGNSNAGVRIADTLGVTTGNQVQGNYIGVDVAAINPLGNGVGVELDGVTGNTIGGSDTGDRNVISGNFGDGVHIIGGGGNNVLGNLIGTDWTGAQAISNFAHGVELTGGSGNVIGGTSSFAGNVISANSYDGLYLDASNANQIQGNLIGTDISGVKALGNLGNFSGFGNGIELVNGSANNIIGGIVNGSRNVISGNHFDGILISNTVSGSLNNFVQGNYIGVDSTGYNALGNFNSGISLQQADGNLIGGTSATAGNVITGNHQNGIYVGSHTTGTLIQGNRIGTNAVGSVGLGNGLYNIEMRGVSGNTIGGSVSGAGNVISGDSFVQVEIGTDIFTGAVSASNIVQGNKIGTDALGTTFLPGGIGINIEGSSNNQIGGTTSLAGNQILGGLGIGGDSFSNSATGNTLQGNRIGTDAAGTHAIGGSTIFIGPGATGNLIGGTVAGAGNLISGAGSDGIYLYFADGNTIQGNKIGTDITGKVALSSHGAGGNGIRLDSGNNNLIGGTAPGAGNLISGNGSDGILVLGNFGPFGQNNIIQGNLIGTDITGKKAVPNRGSGIDVNYFASNTLIGGSAAGAGNIISGNGGHGVSLANGSTGTIVQGNKIGTDITGNAALPNNGMGIYASGSDTSLIGGLAAGQGNLIAGNRGDGIFMDGPNNVIEGNTIGASSKKSASLGNGGNGITVYAADGVIGAPGAGNVISGNKGNGIEILSGYYPITTGVLIQSNRIGTDAGGTVSLGNGGNGVWIDTSSVVVGGTGAGQGNTIAFNGGDGVFVNSGTGNSIRGNSIFENVGLGIELFVDNAANNLLAAPVLTSAVNSGGSTTVQGTLSGTGILANTTYTIDLYSSPKSDPSGRGEGKVYLGSVMVTTNSSGVATFSTVLSPSVTKGQFITATTNDAIFDTSEFSNWVKVTA